MITQFFTALSFLTLVPTPFLDSKKSDLAKSTIFFPVIGLFIGAIAWGLFHVALMFLPLRIALLILLTVPIFVSGGLHIDGFADACDGLFGGKDRSSMLRIMKDSRIGTWGALGVVLLILAKWELLLALSHKGVFFILALTSSRWAQVVLSFFLPYVGDGPGLGEMVAKKIHARELIGASANLFVIFFMAAKVWAVLPCLLFFLLLIALFYKLKLGGITGDLLGAASELTEVFILLAGVILEKSFL